MPEPDEEVERAEERVPGEDLESPDETRWGLHEGDEIVPGRYALKRLGGGSDYEAYLAWDDRLFALVVAKILRPHLVDDPGSIGALRREAELLLRLNHPVVVRGFDTVLEGPRPHVVMEHLEGSNLASLLRRFGRLELEQLLPLTLQIASAVHYLGTEEIVHLDIKPRNIIMGAPPRLIDFSIARSVSRARRISGHAGTDPYMAPEQCDPSSGRIGPKADIWGLGASLHHAIAGQVPFPRPEYDRENDKDNLERRFPQLHEEPQPLPPDVPAALQDVVSACLAKDPDERPQVREIVAAIEPLIAALPTKPSLRRGRPRARR